MLLHPQKAMLYQWTESKWYVPDLSWIFHIDTKRMLEALNYGIDHLHVIKWNIIILMNQFSYVTNLVTRITWWIFIWYVTGQTKWVHETCISPYTDSTILVTMASILAETSLEHIPFIHMGKYYIVKWLLSPRKSCSCLG